MAHEVLGIEVILVIKTHMIPSSKQLVDQRHFS